MRSFYWLASLGVAFALVSGAVRPGYSQETPPSRGPVRVVLGELPLGDAAVRTASTELTELIDATSRSLRRSIVIVGKPGLTAEQVRGLQGRAAREVMGAISQSMGAEWQRYDEFYLMWPADMQRHEALPVRWSRRYRELEHPVEGVFASDFVHAVRSAGHSGGASLLLGPADTREAMQRTVLPALIACHGGTVDELMQALTAVTGDPWDHIGSAHLLCFSGKALTPAQREQMATGVAAAGFAQSLTGPQERLLQSPEGLTAARLPAAQRDRLAAATARMREPGGIGVEQLVLRRVLSGNDTYSDRIYVEANTPGGRVRLGMITAPL